MSADTPDVRSWAVESVDCALNSYSGRRKSELVGAATCCKRRPSLHLRRDASRLVPRRLVARGQQVFEAVFAHTVVER